MRLAGALLGAVVLSSTQTSVVAAGPRGVVPEGLWVLDPHKSKELHPGSQTLWVLKDDGHTLLWVSALRDPEGAVHVASFEGVYGGPPSALVGGPMRTRISSPGPGRLHNEGEMIGVGPYHEDCTVQDAGKTFSCDGEVQAAGGSQRWHDHFVYSGPSPGA